MQPSNVTQVLGVATRKDGSEIRGIGKNNKPWVIYNVILDNGLKLGVFGPVEVGDLVYDLVEESTIKGDREYKNWKGKVKSKADSRLPNDAHDLVDANQPTNAQILEAIRTTYKHIDEVKDELTDIIAKITLDADTKALVDAQAPRQKVDTGRGANRDMPDDLPTDDEMEEIISSGEPIDLNDIPF